MVGLRKIDEATEQLIVLNELLEKQKIVVAEKTLACEMILREISEGIKLIKSIKLKYKIWPLPVHSCYLLSFYT